MRVEISRVLEKIAGAMNVGLTRVTPPFEGIENFDYGLRRALDAEFDWQGFGRQLLEQTPKKTLVFAQGVFELRFALFLAPDEKDTLYCLGPWADGPRSEGSVKWCEKYLDEKAQKVVEEYYNRVRQLEDNSIKTALFAVISLAFPEGELKTAEWREFMPLHFRPSLESFREASFTEKLPAELIAERYAAENKMLEAVRKGDTAAALAAYENFHQFQLAPRLRSPLREFKNYTIILNSLFRKAIEQASVHPYYLDHISARFALELETLGSVEEGRRLRVRMVKEYCRYVQQYSLRQYSPLIQKVINEINLHLDAALSLKTLAAQCYISPSYLSNVFKQETGQTLTDYISSRRMERAAQLLLTTNARVATVAEEVGILDVNYFTKMFKSATGQTPTAYRRDKRMQASLEVAPEGAAPLPPAAKNGKN